MGTNHLQVSREYSLSCYGIKYVFVWFAITVNSSYPKIAVNTIYKALTMQWISYPVIYLIQFHPLNLREVPVIITTHRRTQNG